MVKLAKNLLYGMAGGFCTPQPEAAEGMEMATNTMKRYGSTGYIVRDIKNRPYGVENGYSVTIGTSTHMPDGKVIRTVDRGLFEKAVRAAVTRKK